jgi:hypothetical protein
MEKGDLVHAPLSEDGAELDEGVDVIGRVEKGEAAAQQSEKDDAARPHVENARLGSTLEQNLRSTEPTSAGTVGSA